ncbi:MAG: Ldh family oxidoreductase [Thermomicrobiales bacterium]
MPICSADQLRGLMTGLFEAVGTPAETSAFIANSLVAANLTGHDSHGVIRILQYIEVVESGALDPKAEAEVVSIDGATLKVDGKWGWGQPAFHLAVNETLRLAREYGIAIGTVDRCFHVGRVAPYVETIARDGMIGIAMANAGPAVAPYGARTRVMGTNPIAWAVPGTDEDQPFALDIATAQIAEGKVRVARNKGVPVPLGVIVNKDGAPSLDPNDFYDGGALMAFGGHKGSGFSILAQLLGRGLAGMTQDRLKTHRGGNGPVVIAIDPARFGPLDLFRDVVTEEAERVRGATPAEGFSEVLMPGDLEVREQARREAEGCMVDDTTWNALVSEAKRFGLAESIYALAS